MSAPVYADGAINDSAAWAEIIHLRAERDAALARIAMLEAALREWVEIFERQFATLPPAPDSVAWQFARNRLDRMWAALGAKAS